MAKKKNNKRNQETDYDIEMAKVRFSMILPAFFCGITPELYSKIFETLSNNPKTLEWFINPESLKPIIDETMVVNIPEMDKRYNGLGSRCMELVRESIEQEEADEEEDQMDDMLQAFANYAESKKTISKFEKTLKPIAGASKKTLRLKIKIQDIVKPPVWRVVDVPADYEFFDLHEIIQIVFGWDNYHLWQFRKKEHGYDFAIRPEDPDDDWGFEEETLSTEIQLTCFLKNKGDKILYEYDFGDYWIHEITVEEVIDRKSAYPILIKSKGDMMIEDIGGAHGYMMWRNYYQNINNYSEEEILNFLHNFSGIETVDEFLDMMNQYRINNDEINEMLKEEFEL